ncbi:hypothetical protein [Staphylococcus kloosii]|uniref:hypothetical protein n=1 Tax=Staphylococcus kloosii TaxID=29384 RepID=UPI0028A41240|nr:hypothetical protein [Staphylococcus kloosii]MDT3959523.1 hypothetical protein [Staphylococcus kloosii]
MSKAAREDKRQEVMQLITDYHWMRRLVDTQVYEYDSTSIGQYGIESSMPKAQGTTGDKVLVRVIRNDKDYCKTQELVDQMNIIDNNEDDITNRRDYHILQLLKQGESKQRIMILLNMKRTNFYEHYESIINFFVNKLV